MKRFIVLLTAIVLFTGCETAKETGSAQASRYQMGVLPPSSPQLLDEEWKIYRSRHPDQDEASARKSFDTIQILSAVKYDKKTAAWADRKALANAWLKKEIEDVYSPETLDDSLIQEAIDAYAFKSGSPSLVTASHLLLHEDGMTTPEERIAALNQVRNEIIAKGDYSNEALSYHAQRLIRAGFKADMNADLTFPKRPMKTFMQEELNYPAVVDEFADAAFALSKDNRLSPVTKSEFGYHLILFISKTEEKKADIKKDRAFMTEQIVRQGRLLATEYGLNALMNQPNRIHYNDARLKEMSEGNTPQTP